MIIDRLQIVSGTIGGSSLSPTLTGQTVTGTNTSVISTDTIDLLQNRDVGQGNGFLKLLTQVGTAFAGLTSLTIEAIQADDAALTSNVTVIGSSGAIPLARLTAGARFVVELNARVGSVGQRYLGARYTIVGTGSAGTVFSHFGDQVQDGQKFYPIGFVVL